MAEETQGSRLSSDSEMEKAPKPLFQSQKSMERGARESQEIYFASDTELDSSFTSYASTTSTDRTFATSFSARTSLSFPDSNRVSSAAPLRPHRRSDPQWSVIAAATNTSPDGTLHLSDLRLIRRLGSGNLGRVFHCQVRGFENADFALKVVDRNTLSAKKLAQAATEASVLAGLDHPFLPTLYAHIEDSHYTCLLIDYCPRGDLHSLLRVRPGNRFRLAAARFYAAEVLVALEYLHARGVVYRDLKPENVLVRGDGHVMLSDFDLCFEADVVPTIERRKVGPAEDIVGCFGFGRRRRRTAAGSNLADEAKFFAEPTHAFSRSCVGTHEYLAPEIVNGKGHGNGVDWWAFGIFLHEMVYGRTPFKGASKEATLRNIATNALRLPEVDVATEEKGAAEARDLMELLLVKDPRKRLGCTKGAHDIKRHPFFAGIKWPLIRCYRPPGVGRSSARDARMCGIEAKRKKRWTSWTKSGYFGNKVSILRLNGKNKKGAKWT